MKLLGIGLIILSGILFYLIFFVLTPFIQSLIPQGEWKSLIDVAIVIVIGWCGGVVLPLVSLIFGIMCIKE